MSGVARWRQGGRHGVGKKAETQVLCRVAWTEDASGLEDTLKPPSLPPSPPLLLLLLQCCAPVLASCSTYEDSLITSWLMLPGKGE
jgi:hypothetical protein